MLFFAVYHQFYPGVAVQRTFNLLEKASPPKKPHWENLLFEISKGSHRIIMINITFVQIKSVQ